MYMPKLTPLDAELIRVKKKYGTWYAASKVADQAFAEFAGNAICLGLSPLESNIPLGKYAIAGGIVRSLFENEIPTDVDIFLLGDDASVRLRIQQLENLYFIKAKKVKVDYGTFYKHVQILNWTPPESPYDIQFIGEWFEHKVSGDITSLKYAEDVLAHFDLVSTCFAVEFEITDNSNSFGNPRPQYVINKVVSHPLLFKCLSKKELRVSPYGPIELKKMRADRFYKYIVEYGFRVPDMDEMAKFNVLLATGALNVDTDYA